MRFLWKGVDITRVAPWAKGVFFSRKNTGLESTNVQDAIVEVNDRVEEIASNILSDFFVTTDTAFNVSIGASTALSFTPQTINKAGYTPIYGILTASSYGDYTTINQTWSLSNGTATVSGWIGNWSSSHTVTLNARVLWRKNTL